MNFGQKETSKLSNLDISILTRLQFGFNFCPPSTLWHVSTSHDYHSKLTLFHTFPCKHREIFSKSCWINPKSDCIYHFPIDLEPNRRPFGFPNQSENVKYNLISGWFNKIYKIFLCVQRQDMTTAIRCLAVRKTSVSRHHGGPPKTPYTITTLLYWGG